MENLQLKESLFTEKTNQTLNGNNKTISGNHMGTVDENGFSYRDLLQQFQDQSQNSAKKREQDTSAQSKQPTPIKEASAETMLNNLSFMSSGYNAASHTVLGSSAGKNVESQKVLMGDFNDDGILDTDDVMAIQDHIVEKKKITDPNMFKRMDLNSDGEIDVFDLTKLTNTIIGREGKKYIEIETQKKEPIKGDLNDDGVIDDADSELMKKTILKRNPYTKAADFDNDGKVTATDLSAFNQTLRKITESTTKTDSTITKENGNKNFAHIGTKITIDENNRLNTALGTGNGDYYIKGDVNGDGVLDISDTIALKMHISGNSEITDINAVKRADYNGDGKISIIDLAQATDAQLGIKPIEYVGQKIEYTQNGDFVGLVEPPIGPGDYALTVLPSGSQVNVLAEDNNWTLVEANGQKMWLSKNIVNMEVGSQVNYNGQWYPFVESRNFFIIGEQDGYYKGAWMNWPKDDGTWEIRVGWIPKNQNVQDTNPVQQGFMPYETNVNYNLVTYGDSSMTKSIGKVYQGEPVTVLDETEDALKIKYGVGTYPNYHSHKIGWIPKNLPIPEPEPIQNGFNQYETSINKDLIGFSDSSFQNVSIAVHNGSTYNVIGETDTALQLSDGANTVWIPKEIRTVNVGVPYYNDNHEYVGTFDVATDFTVLQESDNAYKGIWITSKNSDGTFNYNIGWIPKTFDFQAQIQYGPHKTDDNNIHPTENFDNLINKLKINGEVVLKNQELKNIVDNEELKKADKIRDAFTLLGGVYSYLPDVGKKFNQISSAAKILIDVFKIIKDTGMDDRTKREKLIGIGSSLSSLLGGNSQGIGTAVNGIVNAYVNYNDGRGNLTPEGIAKLTDSFVKLTGQTIQTICGGDAKAKAIASLAVAGYMAGRKIGETIIQYNKDGTFDLKDFANTGIDFAAVLSTEFVNEFTGGASNAFLNFVDDEGNHADNVSNGIKKLLGTV